MNTPTDTPSPVRTRPGVDARTRAPSARQPLLPRRGVATVFSLAIHAALFITVPTCAGFVSVDTEAEVKAASLAMVELAALGDLTAVEELDTGADAGRGEEPVREDAKTAEDLRQETLEESEGDTDISEGPDAYEADGITDNGGSTNEALATKQGNTEAEVETRSADQARGPEEDSSGDAVADAVREDPDASEDLKAAEEAEPDASAEEEEEEEGATEEPAEEETANNEEEEEEEEAPSLREFVATSGGLVNNDLDPEKNTIAELDQSAEIESRSVLLKRSRKQELGTTDKTTNAQEERRKAGSANAREGVRVAGGRLDRAQALRRGAVDVAPTATRAASRAKPTLHLAHASASVMPLPEDYQDVHDVPEWWTPAAARIPPRGRAAAKDLKDRTPEPAPPSAPKESPAPAPPEPTQAPEDEVLPPPLPHTNPEPAEQPERRAPRTATKAQEGALDAVADIDREGDTSEGGEPIEEEPPPDEADDKPIADTEGLLLVDKGIQGAEDGDEGMTVEAPSLFEPMFDSAPSFDDDSTHVTGTESTLSQRYVLGLDNAISARRTPLGSYTHKVYRKLLRNWERLPDADLGLASLSSQVTISFLVFPDGRVVRAKVKTTSGDPMLDGLALASVPKSLPNFPKNLEESSLYYEMTFTYGNGP